MRCRDGAPRPLTRPPPVGPSVAGARQASAEGPAGGSPSRRVARERAIWRRRFLAWRHARREAPTHCDPRAVERLRAAFEGDGLAAARSPVHGLLTGIGRQSARVSCLLLWGSQVRGRPSALSFKVLRDGGRRAVGLLAGPSDLDALLVTTGPVEIPPLPCRYTRLSLEFDVLEEPTCDLARDVISVREPALSRLLATHRRQYASLYLDAYFGGGVILRTSPAVERVFASAARRWDYRRCRRRYLAARERMLARLEQPGSLRP